ncbi:RagB/SusD family nutrient uptake outer membrane protein [Carboxylicivirga marina]|uniref:RagB/SusD family nutrient uptake outer membrane protein n=1 Tax=Carboxylicivirga marina TaxID=2800988 RepID=A0ABS1HNW1_9BACT|nr:RagB/SusD family nutrient uptake outer membrane protein [Carboxylicivirga marina]MBK3519378.1 RagB/SusD family nutrient uptake outer membrane protein [Carboxylicivirga marina]
MKKLYRYIGVLTIGLFLGSCNDFLESVDENLLSEEYLMEDPAYAEGVLLNAYKSVISSTSFSEVATDDAVHNQLGNGYRNIATGQLSSTNNAASRWGKYESVFYINKFLPTVDVVQWSMNEEINELFQFRLKGEALALRALHHFYVLEGHAGYGDNSGQLLGIPYYTEFVEADGNFNVPRLTFTETIDEIIADLDEAIELLPMDYSDSDSDIPLKYQSYDPNNYRQVMGAQNTLRMTGRIAKAIKARVALFAASPAYLNGGGYYEIAAQIAAELINDMGGVTALDPNGIEFYNEDSDADLDELLWRASVYSGSSLESNNFPPSLNGNGHVNPSENLVRSFPMLDGFPIDDSNGIYTYSINTPYVNRDPRLEKYILYNNGRIGNNTIMTGYGAGIDRVDSVMEKSTRSGYYLKKMLRPDVKINNDGSIIAQKRFNSYFRYTELFLILAEAANEIGGKDYAVDGITPNDVILALRNRAGIENPENYLSSIGSPEEMREVIRNERRLELCFEGFRFWDLRRWKDDLSESANGLYYNGTTYEDLLDVEARIYPDYGHYMPIPDADVRRFSNIEQNTGW